MPPSKKAPRIYTKDSLRGAFGVLLAFVAVFFALSAWTKYFWGPAFGVIYLFGLPGYWTLIPLFFISGIAMALRKRLKTKTFYRLLIAYAIVLVGACVLMSALKTVNAIYDYDDDGNEIVISISHFSDWIKSIQGHDHKSLAVTPEIGGGVIGLAIASALVGVNSMVAYGVSIVLILVGLIVAFFPLIKKGIAAFTNKSGSEDDEEEKETSEYSFESSYREDDRGERLLTRQETPIEEETLEPFADIARPTFNDIEPDETPLTRRADIHASNRHERFNENDVTEGYGEVQTSGLSIAHFDFGAAARPAPKEEPKNEESFGVSRFVSPVKEEPKTHDIGLDDFEKKEETDFTPSFLNPVLPADEIKEEPTPVPQEEPIAYNEPVAPLIPQEEDTFEQRYVPEEEAIAPLEEEAIAPAEETPVEPTPVFAAQEEREEPAPIEEEPEAPDIDDAPVFEPKPMSVSEDEYTNFFANQPVAPTPEPEPEPEPVDPVIKLGEKPYVELEPYKAPSYDLLLSYDNSEQMERMVAECEQCQQIIESVYRAYGAKAHVVDFTIGPSVTRYNIACDEGYMASKLTQYTTEISRSLMGALVNFNMVVPGRTTSGLEIPNKTRATVGFREMMENMPPYSPKTALMVPIGRNISGEYKYACFNKFPHLLVAGTTGSGKSIFVHSMIMSLIIRNRPEDLRIVLIDPKRVEFTKYRDIPHLLCPIIQEAGPAKACLNKLIEEMERRNKVFVAAEVNNIDNYNKYYVPEHGVARMPSIIVFVDEFADLMSVDKKIAEPVARLGAKARSAGIHLCIATQHPTVDVISGTIKSNIGARVALRVATMSDSQVIIDQPGAENLIGYGDMLAWIDEIAIGSTTRLQGCFVDEPELKAVGEYLRKLAPANYDPNFLKLEDEDGGFESNDKPDVDALAGLAARAAASEDKYTFIKEEIMKRETTSISMIQREFGVGFPRAGKIMARLQAEGIVAKEAISASRGFKVLVHEIRQSENPGTTEQSSYSPDVEFRM